MSVKSVIQSRELVASSERGHATSAPRKFTVVTCPYLQLSRSDIDRWKVWQATGALQSPYFHPEFTSCVDQVRSDVQVARILQQGKLVGLFPFQIGSGNVAEPVGGAINDYHGIIGEADLGIRQADVLQQLGLRRFRFHSWVSPDESMTPHIYENEPATIADLSQGSKALLDELVRNSSTIKRHPQKTRKLIRELGPLRLELNSPDQEALEWVIQRKRDRYAKSGIVDFFGVEWTRQLVRRIHQTQTDEFHGMLSTLYAGETLVAAHFGMRCGSILHYWYPVYDPRYQRYSPGTQLFLEIVNRAEDVGICAIDFGYGRDAYKSKLTNRQFEVARGCVDFNRLRGMWNKSLDHVICRIKNSPAKQPVKRVIRMISPAAGQPRV